MDYYKQLDAIRAAGHEFARDCIAAGIPAQFADLGDFGQTDVLDSWEGGYYAADWPYDN